MALDGPTPEFMPLAKSGASERNRVFPRRIFNAR
jgi:hypothetical protein